MPRLVTELGIVIVVRPTQPEKAVLPIPVTVFGIVTDVMPVEFRKASDPIDTTEYVLFVHVTEDGIVTLPLYRLYIPPS